MPEEETPQESENVADGTPKTEPLEDWPVSLKTWRRAFLSSFAQYGCLVKAADAAGVTTRSVQRAKANEPDFARCYEEARQAGAAYLESVAVKRATEGTRILKFFEGRPIRLNDGTLYEEHSYSDALLILLLKRHMPEEYAERRKTEVSGGLLIEPELADKIAAKRAERLRGLRDRKAAQKPAPSDNDNAGETHPPGE